MPTSFHPVRESQWVAAVIDQFILEPQKADVWMYCERQYDYIKNTGGASISMPIPVGVSETHIRDILGVVVAFAGGRQVTQEQAEAVPSRGSALSVQVAGSHYKDKAIQPVEYIHANGLGFLEGCIVKRITRWRDKGGTEDLQKIKHEIDLLIELEGRKIQQSS